jgi:hypothetical protein
MKWKILQPKFNWKSIVYSICKNWQEKNNMEIMLFDLINFSLAFSHFRWVFSSRSEKESFSRWVDYSIFNFDKFLNTLGSRKLHELYNIKNQKKLEESSKKAQLSIHQIDQNLYKKAKYLRWVLLSLIKRHEIRYIINFTMIHWASKNNFIYETKRKQQKNLYSHFLQMILFKIQLNVKDLGSRHPKRKYYNFHIIFTFRHKKYFFHLFLYIPTILRLTIFLLSFRYIQIYSDKKKRQRFFYIEAQAFHG